MRTKCILSKNEDLELIHTYKNVPIYCGQTSLSSDYEYEDLELSISKSSGIIQITKLIPLEKLYMYSHNDAIGKLWESHFSELYNFSKECISKRKVIEYGGGSCKIYTKAKDECLDWTIVDINPLISENGNLKVVSEQADVYFDDADVYFHSHFLEHLYEPYDFIKHICSKSKIGTNHIFSIPNQKLWMRNGFCNSIFFEHTTILEIEYIQNLHKKYGYFLKDFKYFGEHSIFFNFEKITESDSSTDVINIDGLYEQNKQLLIDYVNGIETKKKEYVRMIGHSKYNIFSAHIQTQIMFCNGIDYKMCRNVVDNSDLKIGKVLYGYNIPIVSPNDSDKDIITIVPTSPYETEIKSQLKCLGYSNVV